MDLNLKTLFARFADEQVCRDYLVQSRWNGTPICPYCSCGKSYVIEGGKRFKCADKNCYKKYSVTVGTVMEATNIPLSTWLPALYIITAHKKGISSVQLAKDLGVTQKTAWFMNHRIRQSLKEKNSPLLGGTVEIDETYMSRKYASDYKAISAEQSEKMERETIHKKFKKGAVIGMKQREGKVRVIAVDNTKAKTIGDTIKANTIPDVHLMSDESLKYVNELSAYSRETVNHSNLEWVRGNVHTNGIENFWSVMKRGIHGIYHQISFKHLQRYLDEFSYRYNSRELTDGKRFEIAVTGIEGRLKYVTLINGKDKDSKPQA